MAGGGVGEAALIGAVVGGGASAIQGKDPLEGALMGAALGGVGSGISGALMPEAAAATAGAGADVAANAFTASSPTGLAMVPADLGVSAPSGISSLLPTTTGGKVALGLGTTLAGSMLADQNRFGVPNPKEYSGPLNRFKYDPSSYQPDIVNPPMSPYQAQYAAGGAIEQMSNANAVGMNTGYPQSDITGHAYSTPWQTPISQNVVQGTADTGVNRMSGQMLAEGGGISGLMNYAGGGGISSLGKYSDGGRMLKGPGDGMSDSIPATISGKQPARLADGEFVVPADVVSHLGNGSTDAGARQLYKMMDKVRTARTGRKAQGRQINPKRYMPA